MGTLTLSGVLKRPVSGDVVPNARIVFDAIATGTVVLKGVSSACKTAADGSYAVDLEYGDYAIQVSWAGQTQQYGTVHIDDSTPMGTLNDLLLQQLMESEVTPEVVLEFRQLQQEMQEDLAQMEELNTDASASASAAAASQAAAKTSETNSATSEDAAAVSASAANVSETNAAASEDAAAASASAASASETNSAASEDAAAVSASAASVSETNAAASEVAAAASASAASASETNSAASEDAAAASATGAKTSETNSATSEAAASTSELNAEAARDAAEEYANEAKDAASKVTAPLTDQGQWAIQSGYPRTPDVASVWQVTDGGVDPVNSDILWDPGDMLVYLATSGTWCRLLGQQTVSGEPVPLKFDSDIILNVGAGLQIVTSSTTAVDVARLDSDNYLVLGDDAVLGVCLAAADPTNMFVLVPDGSGGYTKSRIYTEQYKPTVDDLGFGSAADCDVGTTAGTVAAGDDSRIVNALQSNMVVSSTTDTTSGRLPVVGYEGLGGTAIDITDATLDSGSVIQGSAFIRQGGGTSDIHFGNYGAGVNIHYGTNSDGSNLYARLFVRADGVAISEFIAINADGSIRTQEFNTLFGELNPPTAAQTGALPITGGQLTGQLGITADNGAIDLTSKTGKDALYIFAQDADGTKRFFIGNGSAQDYSLALNNYVGGNSVSLAQDGTLSLNATHSKPIACATFVSVTDTFGAGSFASQYTQYSPYYHEFNDTQTSSYHPLWKIKDLVNGVMWSGGMLINAEQFAIQCIKSDGTQEIFYFKPDGSFSVSGELVPGKYDNFDAKYQKINTASLAANGWFKDSTGFIHQFGANATGTATITVTYPIAFPSGVSSPVINYSVNTVSTTSFTLELAESNPLYWQVDGWGAAVAEVESLKQNLSAPEFTTAYLYSPSNNAFYPVELYFDYIYHGTWPDDAIAVDDSVYREFAANVAPEGKIRAAGEDSMPCWADVPAPTEAQIVARNTATQNRLLQASAVASFPLQSRVDAGIATDKQVSLLAALKQYSIDLTDPAVVDLTVNPAVFPEFPA